MLIYDVLYAEKLSCIFVSSYLEGKVYKLNEDGSVIFKYGGFKNPLSLVSVEGNVYLLDVGTLIFYKYSPEEDKWKVERFPLEVSHPAWVASLNGKLIFVDKGKGKILGFEKEVQPVGPLESLPRVYDMPSSIKFSFNKAFLLADGERVIVELSLEGIPVSLWKLPSSPISWAVHKGKPYFLFRGFLLTVSNENSFSKLTLPNSYKAILSRDEGVLLWSGKAFAEPVGEEEELVSEPLPPYKLLILKRNFDDRVKDLKSFVSELEKEEKETASSFSEFVEEFHREPTLEKALELHSRRLPLEFKIKRAYPNLVSFMDSLKSGWSDAVIPYLLKLFNIFLAIDRGWYFPWEIYWRIPLSEREGFKEGLYRSLRGPSVDIDQIFNVITLSLDELKKCMDMLLNKELLQDAKRALDLWHWINRLYQLALIINGKGGDIAKWWDCFAKWREGIDYLKYIDSPFREALGKAFGDLWVWNLFYHCLVEERKEGMFRHLSQKGGKPERVGDFFLISYAKLHDGYLYISDWGEGLLYKLSLNGEIIWKKEAYAPFYMAFEESKIFLSQALHNEVLILDSDRGDLLEKIALRGGERITRVWHSDRWGIIGACISSEGTVIKDLLNNRKIFSIKGGGISYLKNDDAFLLQFPSAVKSYVSDPLKIHFHPQLLNSRDNIYVGNRYLINLLWLGKVKSFRFNEVEGVNEINDVLTGLIYPPIPLSFSKGKLALIHPWGYLDKVIMDE